MLSICEGVQHCHFEGVIHQDIQPSNILIVNSQPKIAGFGILNTIENTVQQLTPRVPDGLKPYTAPEILKNHKIRFKGDIWSLGCLFYELCTLKKAYPKAYSKEISINYSELDRYSMRIKKLIMNMLQVERDFRPPINWVIGSIIINIP